MFKFCLISILLLSGLMFRQNTVNNKENKLSHYLTATLDKTDGLVTI